MIIKFDSLNRYEVPSLYLCSPGSRYNNGMLTNNIGCLCDTTDEELILNFNTASELNFRMYRIKRDNAEEDAYARKIYRSLQNRRLIFVENIGYFVINSVQDGYSDGMYYKDVRAESCEVEIENKMLTYVANDTYPFVELLEKIIETVPMWTIGSIDPIVEAKHRTFENVSIDINTLSFMLDNMQDAYECIFCFDIIHRIINVYDQSNYVVQTNIHLTKDDVINSITIIENSDDLYTAISVLGDEELNISPVNPLGTNVIYNFDYYLNWMTDSLREKVIAWQALVASYTDQYYELNLSYYTDMTARSVMESAMSRLETQIELYRRCRDSIVASGSAEGADGYNDVIEEAGGTAIDLSAEIEEIKAEIDERIALAQDEYDDTRIALDAINNEMNTIRESILAIHSAVAITEYFSEDEYSELYNYIYEGSYQDEYIAVTSSMTYAEKFQQMKVLYDRAVSQLEKVSKPTQEFSIDVENFIFEKEFSAWSEQLETGCLINVELDSDDVAMLFLSSFTINYYDRTLSMTFGNRFNRFDPKSMFDNVLGDIKKSANTLDYIRDIIYPIENGEFNAMREAIEASRTLTKNAALASRNQEVIIDDTGYTGRVILDSGLYDPRQIKITGKSIVFTDDAWETCKVALGEIILGDGQTTYGVSAETIIGNIILGNNLHILDNHGNDLLTVVDDRIYASVSNYDDRIAALEMTADGVEIRITELENDDEEVTSVTTTTGYTFNADGLRIHKEGEEIVNRIDNTGMYVTRGDDNVLTANNLGVEAINLKANQYLIVGRNSRLENYSNGTDTKRTGCFYIGG